MSKNAIFIVKFAAYGKAMYKSDVYYDRTMNSIIYNQIKEVGQYHWMIHYVKDHPVLDLQTGSNRSNSWFSIYCGTSKILKIEKK